MIWKKYQRGEKMNEALNTYIRNQVLLRTNKLNEDLIYKDIKFNSRLEYDTITGYIDDFLDGNTINRYLVLPGIRDVGKTTILYQVYEYLLKQKGVNPKNILYLSADRLKIIANGSILDAINTYLNIYHRSILETVKEPIFLLIDEAQYDGNWALSGKIIFDASKNIFMIFTGSSALKLSYNADSARRLLNIPVLPLSYSEHLKLKYGHFNDEISKSINKIIFEGQSEMGDLESKIFSMFANYNDYDLSEWVNFLQFGGFPSSFYQKQNEVTKKLIDMVYKVVSMDMGNIEGINGSTQTIAFRILYYLAFQNPGAISMESLANQFDTNKNLIGKVLDILLKTQLIFKVPPFTSSSKRTTKPNEYFFATSSLKHNLALDLGNASLEDETAYMGKLLENFVASSFINLDNKSHIPYKIYYDDKKRKSNDKNVDFIIQRNLEKPIPIEVSCGKKNKSQIKRAISKYGASHGIIISNTTDFIMVDDDVIYMPPEIFALM